MIPGGSDKYAKLKISAGYEVKRKTYAVVHGADVYPEWAVVANFNFLRKHLSWLDQVINPLADELMSVPFCNEWIKAMGILRSSLLSKGWCCYMTNAGGLSTPLFMCTLNSSVLDTFGKEFFGGEIQSPAAVVFPYAKVTSVMVGIRDKQQKMDRAQFAKVLGYTEDIGGKGDAKFKYVSLVQFIQDYKDHKVDYTGWTQADWDKLKSFTNPPVVNTTARIPSLFDTLIIFLYTWVVIRTRENLPIYSTKLYSSEVQEGLAAMADRRKKKPLTDTPPKPGAPKPTTTPKTPTAPTTTPKEPTVPSSKVESLEEALLAVGYQTLTEGKSYAQLLANTRNHGRYRIGGMVRVDGRWTNDISIPGRLDNARFVIASPPLTHIEPDGSVIYRWKFKSRADRSTTGTTHRGYLQVMPKKKGIMAFLKRLVKGDGPWEGDCKVWCSCQDFRFVSHYANWQADSSHKPTGQNGDAIFSPPIRTNPRRIPMLCKHLCMASVFLKDVPKKLRDEVSEIQRMADEQQYKPTSAYEPPEPIEPEAPEPQRIGGVVNPTNRIG